MVDANKQTVQKEKDKTLVNINGTIFGDKPLMDEKFKFTKRTTIQPGFFYIGHFLNDEAMFLTERISGQL